MQLGGVSRRKAVVNLIQGMLSSSVLTSDACSMFPSPVRGGSKVQLLFRLCALFLKIDHSARTEAFRSCSINPNTIRKLEEGKIQHPSSNRVNCG